MRRPCSNINQRMNRGWRYDLWWFLELLTVKIYSVFKGSTHNNRAKPNTKRARSARHETRATGNDPSPLNTATHYKSCLDCLQFYNWSWLRLNLHQFQNILGGATPNVSGMYSYQGINIKQYTYCTLYYTCNKEYHMVRNPSLFTIYD